MKTFIRIIVAITIATATLTSCIDGIIISGNGDYTEQSRQLPSFNQVYSAGSFNIIYTHGDSSSVKVSCESNLLPYIETAVFNNKLDIRFATHVSISTHQQINIYVTSPSVKAMQLDGSGAIIADSLTGNDMKLTLSGSGNIETTFYGKYLESSVSGSGKIDIKGICDTLETSISGSGTIEIESPACKLTTVDITGSGKATLSGSSDKASFQIFGSGRINAYDFPVKRADVVVGGSGTIKVNVADFLNAVISGSGDIYYIGNPKINFSDNGSGNLVNQN